MSLTNIIKYTLGKIICIIHKINRSGGGIYISPSVKIVNQGSVKMGSNVSIRPSCNIYLSNKISWMEFGNGTEIGNHSTISCEHTIIFGKDVLTGPHVFISDHNHQYEDIFTPISKQGIRCNEDSKIVIGDGTWIGTNAVIVGSVHIGKNCVVGANSVVTKNIPDFCVVVGSPAKIIKKYDQKTNKWEKID